MLLYLLKYFFESKLYTVLPEKSVKGMQLKRLRKSFEWAKEHSEFYRKVYADADVLDLEINSFEDVKKIPIVDKDMMRNYGIESVLTDKNTSNLVHTTTSGTTGNPFDIYMTKKEHFTSYVRTFIALKNFNPFKRFGLIGIYKQKEKIEKHTFLYYIQRYLGLFQRVKFSFLIQPEEIIENLKRQKIDVLASSPSCLKVVADELKKSGQKLSVNYLATAGETLFDDVKEDLQTYFQAKVINVYGSMEHTSLSWTKPDGDIFHYLPNSIFLEYTNIVEIEGELYGELVITNFVNKTMPFVRYNVGDHVKIIDSHNTMGTIKGRAEDILELNNGRKVFMVQLYQFAFIAGIAQYKFLQKKDKRIIFQVVCKMGADKEKLEERSMKMWLKHFGDHPFEVEFIQEFPVNSKTGKFKRLEVED